MADYYQLKNQNIFNPPANTVLGTANNQFTSAYVQDELVLGNVVITGSAVNTPKITSIGYPGDDTAANTAGGQTITLTGSGFESGASVLINSVAASVVTVVNSTTITFTSPANSTGSYIVYVVNPDGGTAVAVPGIQYSGTPSWTTPAGSLGNVYETNSFDSTVSATGDAPITYSVLSGTLPPGATFNSNGTITGTSQLLSSPTTYNFTVKATDAELQDTSRSFSLTINPDVVTWSSPTNGTSYILPADTAISNITLSATSAAGSGITYSANALPTGISLSGNTISGTPTVAANTSSLLTATANTTSESSIITIDWVVNLATDVYFDYVTTLLPGADTTFIDDNSTNNFPITIVGDSKPNNLNPYTPGYYSNYFDGNGDYLTTPSNAALTLGTADFTLECWVYATSTPSDVGIFESRTNSDASDGFTLTAFSSSVIRIFCGGILIASTGTSYVGSWCHVAVTRSSGTWYLFINGVSQGSSATSRNLTNTSALIGAGRYTSSSSPSAFFPGYISNLRIIKGTALYTSNFTPSTTPLTAISGTSLLTCQSNRFIDNSANNFTVTQNGDTSIKSYSPFTSNSSYSSYGSGYFDGSGDYLTVPTSTAFDFGTGDFTVEAWIYLNPGVTEGCFLSGSAVGSTDLVYYSNSLRFGRNNVAWDSTFNYTLVPNQWYHIAFVKASGVAAVYVNGALIGSQANTNDYGTVGGNIIINASRDASRQFPGYISNYRIVKGTAVYTSAFTPPTQPLTAISGTSILTLQSNQSINNNIFLDNSTNNLFVTRSGNTTQGSFSPYGGGWSNYFDGTGDYLSFPNNTAFAFGTGSYTIEFWINGPLNNNKFILTGRAAIGTMHITTGGYESTAGVLRYVGSSTIVSSNVITDNTWHHCAIVRNGSSNITLYVDGVSVGTGTDTTNYTGTSGTWYIASNDSSGVGSDTPTAYISNLRIVKGTAVYTSAFTPSTTPLTAISGTSLLTSQSNRFIDNSANNFTITKSGDTSVQKFNPFGIQTAMVPQSYSSYFDGDGDYLTTPSNAAFNFGTDDLTIECWIYPTAFNSFNYWYSNGNSSVSALKAMYQSNGNQGISIGNWGGSDLYFTGASVLLNSWNHIAITRQSGTWRGFVNGVLAGSSTSALNMPTGQQSYIGTAPNTSQNTTGYISNFRIVKGTAVYTSAFTPSTTPLTAISGTSLLTCQSATFVDNSTNNFAITAAGNSQPTTVNPFGTTAGTSQAYTPSVFGGSMYFDGSGDYLTAGTFAPGTGNFTIECWFYVNSIPGAQGMLFATPWPSNNFQLFVESSTSSIWWQAYNQNNTAVPIKFKQWYHVAVVRNGSNISMYLNGVLQNTATGSNNISGTATVGSRGAELYFDGYISDLRVSSSTVYTSNFTPSTTPLTSIPNTTLLLNGTNAGIYDASTMNNLETLSDTKLITSLSKFGGSSMYFDGSGDYLFASTSPNYNISTGNFTLELWFRPSVVTDYRAVIGVGTTGGAQTGIGIQQRNNAGINVVYSGSSGSSFQETTGLTLLVNNWYHLALVRNVNNITLYVNGTSYASFTSPTNLGTGSWNLYVGQGFGISGGQLTLESPFAGYIDDVRLTKGIARYTSNFTAPTEPFFTY